MKIIYKDKVTKEYKRAEFSPPAGGVANLRKFVLAVRKVVADAKKEKVKKVAIVLKDLPKLATLGVGERECGEIIAREVLLADYEFTRYLSKPKEGWNFINEVAIVGPASRKTSQDFRDGIERGKIIAGEINMCRELSNTPGGEMTPSALAEAAREAAKGLSVEVKVLDRVEMEQIGMGAIVGVAKGSSEEPQFIIVEYKGAEPQGSTSRGSGGRTFEPNSRPIVLVGKGVTFDSGGLNIKPSDGAFMHEMHMDMSGGAAVIHTVVLAAKLGIKKNIIALVPAVENMPSGGSYRPGDILRSLSGKTIEIKNTDAEGRVILADAITYAKNYDPSMVIDVATLTGAIMVALGARASGLFTRDFELENTTRALGERTGDYVWPMPLWEEYESEVKGIFGDVANLGKNGRYGGAIAAAVFLLQFAKELPKDCKWMHLDIAGTMTPTDDEHLAKGAKGSPMKLLLALIEKY